MVRRGKVRWGMANGWGTVRRGKVGRGWVGRGVVRYGEVRLMGGVW